MTNPTSNIVVHAKAVSNCVKTARKGPRAKDVRCIVQVAGFTNASTVAKEESVHIAHYRCAKTAIYTVMAAKKFIAKDARNFAILVINVIASLATLWSDAQTV